MGYKVEIELDTLIAAASVLLGDGRRDIAERLIDGLLDGFGLDLVVQSSVTEVVET